MRPTALLTATLTAAALLGSACGDDGASPANDTATTADTTADAVGGDATTTADDDTAEASPDGDTGVAPDDTGVTAGDTDGPPTTCLLEDGADAPNYLLGLGCEGDFDALASEPLDTSIPGARSVKVVLDQLGGDTLYFQNSVKYQIHHAFASANLSGGALPVVPALSEFNTTEYFSPDRRFLLGAVTYYEGPGVWALEIAPYDTASPAMIQKLYDAVRARAWFGHDLAFHPTSTAVAATAAGLPGDVAVVTTDTIYAGIDYQPLNLAVAFGRLHVMTAEELATTYVPYRDIVVLDHVPNDISVVAGIITEEFQTPLSHINVLSQNRRTPNMGLKGATTNAELLALDGEWVRLEVGALSWSIRAATLEEADAWWEEHRPTPVVLPAANVAVTDFVDIEDVTPEPAAGESLRDALATAVLAFGGKAAHYSVLARTANVPHRPAFAIPAFYYVQFFEENGLYDELDAMQADEAFRDDPAVRDQMLASFRAHIATGTVNADFQRKLKLKLALEYPGEDMRYRSSTNSEDLDGFPCAGCYESHTGDADDWEDTLDAIRDTWASGFSFRTFEERAYYGVDHDSVVMPLLVHHNFPDETANGVALTANPFDSTGLQPGFYINVQYGGDVEVVHPPAGTTSDEIIYQFDEPGQPVNYISHSNLVGEGETVLTTTQLHELGVALEAIHKRFSPAYGPLAGNTGWYAMDVEFKFESPAEGEPATLFIKQARPNPGRGE